MIRVEYQVYEKESGMTVAWTDSLKDALHYLSVYNQDFPHGLYEVTYRELTLIDLIPDEEWMSDEPDRWKIEAGS